jgi:hypothetical protein
MSFHNARETGSDNEFSNDGFDGLEGWRKFCAQVAPPPPAIDWNRPLRQMKRVLPVSFATLLGLAGCGGGGGSIAPSISVAFSTNPPSTLTTNATAAIAATVSNDSAAAGVTWSVTCGSPQCGSISPSSTASGATTTYTAPASVPASGIVTVTATSVSDGTQSAASTIMIKTAQPSGPILSDGTYIYHYSGQIKSGLFFVAGAFTVKAGVITAGEQDFTGPTYFATDTLNPAHCSLAAAAGNIQIVLDTGDASIGVNGIETLHGAQVSPSRVLLSQFDASGAGSGALDLQTGVTPLAGSYAFYTSGSDQAGQGLAIGGVLAFSNGTLVTANSVFDYNDNMVVLRQKQGFASGSVSAPDSFGRVTLSLAPSGNSGIQPLTLTGYVNGTQLQLIESQSDALNGFTGGVALSQGTNAGTFTASAAFVAGTSYAFGASGMDPNGTTNLAGGLGLNGDGTVSGSMAINDLVNSFGFSISGGTYTVDPTGRVTVSNVTSPSFVGTLTFQLYLDGNGNALELGVDASEVTGAAAYAQQASSADFEGGYAFAAQGFWTASLTAYPGWSAAGVMSIASDAISGFSDFTLQNGNGSFTPTANVAVSGTQNSSSGLLRLFGINAGGFQAESDYGYYPIDEHRVIAIQVDGQRTGQQGVMLLEAIQAN